VTWAPTPSVTTRTRPKASPRSRPHLLGREHGGRQRLLPRNSSEDEGSLTTRLQPRLGDLGNYASDLKGVPLTPGKAYTITLDLAATDHVVPAGHRLALIVAGTDKDLIDPPSTTPTLTLSLSRTAAQLPLVGGASAFAKATAGAGSTTPASTTLDGVSGTPFRPAGTGQLISGSVRGGGASAFRRPAPSAPTTDNLVQDPVRMPGRGPETRSHNRCRHKSAPHRVHGIHDQAALA